VLILLHHGVQNRVGLRMAAVRALTTKEERRPRLSRKLDFPASRGNDLSFLKTFMDISHITYKGTKKQHFLHSAITLPVSLSLV
jgi:hypothetical protein